MYEIAEKLLMPDSYLYNAMALVEYAINGKYLDGGEYPVSKHLDAEYKLNTITSIKQYFGKEWADFISSDPSVVDIGFGQICMIIRDDEKNHIDGNMTVVYTPQACAFITNKFTVEDPSSVMNAIYGLFTCVLPRMNRFLLIEPIQYSIGAIELGIAYFAAMGINVMETAADLEKFISSLELNKGDSSIGVRFNALNVRNNIAPDFVHALYDFIHEDNKNVPILVFEDHHEYLTDAQIMGATDRFINYCVNHVLVRNDYDEVCARIDDKPQEDETDKDADDASDSDMDTIKDILNELHCLDPEKAVYPDLYSISINDEFKSVMTKFFELMTDKYDVKFPITAEEYCTIAQSFAYYGFSSSESLRDFSNCNRLLYVAAQGHAEDLSTTETGKIGVILLGTYQHKLTDVLGEYVDYGGEHIHVAHYIRALLHICKVTAGDKYGHMFDDLQEGQIFDMVDAAFHQIRYFKDKNRKPTKIECIVLERIMGAIAKMMVLMATHINAIEPWEKGGPGLADQPADVRSKVIYLLYMMVQMAEGVLPIEDVNGMQNDFYLALMGLLSAHICTIDQEMKDTLLAKTTGVPDDVNIGRINNTADKVRNFLRANYFDMSLITSPDDPYLALYNPSTIYVGIMKYCDEFASNKDVVKQAIVEQRARQAELDAKKAEKNKSSVSTTRVEDGLDMSMFGSSLDNLFGNKGEPNGEV